MLRKPIQLINLFL